MCKEKHNTLIHEQGESSFSGHLATQRQAMLATAVVPIYTQNGMIFYMKALIDPGSTCTFITQEAAQKMKLSKTKAFTPISSINEAMSTAKFKTNFTFGSCHDPQFKYNADAVIIKKISQISPSHSVTQSEDWEHIKGLRLAFWRGHLCGYRTE